MTRYFTGTGDNGTTGLCSPNRISKSDALIKAIGNVYELNCSIGVALEYVDDKTISKGLVAVQNDLFAVGASLASADRKGAGREQRMGKPLLRLESGIKKLGGRMPALNKFVLPGGSVECALLYLSGAVARRTEVSIIEARKEHAVDSSLISYMNRLSSYLFVVARYLNTSKGVKEKHPTY